MLRFTDLFKSIIRQSIQMSAEFQTGAILLLLDCSADWKRLKSFYETANKQYWEDKRRLSQDTESSAKATSAKTTPNPASTMTVKSPAKPLVSGSSDVEGQTAATIPPLPKLIVVANTKEELAGAKEEGFDCIDLWLPNCTTQERLSQALWKAMSIELIPSRSTVVALYSEFGADEINSISLTHLDEHFEKLTSHDLRTLGTTVPLDVLKVVVDLAIEIGQDGREGKPIGALFVIGDAKRVLEFSHSAGFDPVRGYSREERNILNAKVREGIKEIAQLDGGFVISSKGTVEAACKMIIATAKNITLSKGLGTRHWAAAAISRACNAVAIVVSQSSGTVRIFQKGEVVLRIEPTKRRPVIWRENSSK